MTPVSYKEAALFLEIPETRLRNAISRGTLTQSPDKRYHKEVYLEQLELFKGKQLSLSALNPQERQLWEQYDKAAKEGTKIEASPMSVQIPANNPDVNRAITTLARMGKAASVQGSEVPQGANFTVTMSFQF